jgi:hypothetical protein
MAVETARRLASKLGLALPSSPAEGAQLELFGGDASA